MSVSSPVSVCLFVYSYIDGCQRSKLTLSGMPTSAMPQGFPAFSSKLVLATLLDVQCRKSYIKIVR